MWGEIVIGRRTYSLLDLVLSLAEAMDLVSSALVNHHKRVAHFAASLARALGLSVREQGILGVAGLLHDSGAMSLHERLQALDFEADFDAGGDCGHAYLSYVMVRKFDAFSEVAPLVRYHHLRWDRTGHGLGDEVRRSATLLHLADRIDVLTKKEEPVLAQVPAIVEQIGRRSGTMFCPEHVDCFTRLAREEHFWLDATCKGGPVALRQLLGAFDLPLDRDELISLSRVFAQVIDFRTRFTATHSAGVSATAEALAERFNFSPGECQEMKLAGYLHDLGKLAVPTEILDKPGKLTPQEFAVIRGHTYHTHRILGGIDGLETVTRWAAFHHERLDGKGYPFHLNGDDMSLGARIMAVADVLTAITEDRPYRLGMSREKALAVLDSMSGNSVLDSEVVNVLRGSFDEINDMRVGAQADALHEFEHAAEHTSEFVVA